MKKTVASQVYLIKKVTVPLTKLVVFNKNLNKIIGSTRFYLSTKDSIKIGYTFLSPEYWGTGANKEIKKAMLDYQNGKMGQLQ